MIVFFINTCMITVSLHVPQFYTINAGVNFIGGIFMGDFNRIFCNKHILACKVYTNNSTFNYIVTNGIRNQFADFSGWRITNRQRLLTVYCL